MRSGYCEKEIRFLVTGFREGFNLEYDGPWDRRDTSRNLPFRDGIGSPQELWDKVIKEVKLKRYAGPFKKIPFNRFVQSPIGLVPKHGGQTRLIFHLSYDFCKYKSVNFYIPKEKCSVKYRDLDHAIQNCLKILERFPDAVIWMGITDLKSAFRLVPMNKISWILLLMHATNLVDKVEYYFVDKCMPFGASISCAIFQRISNTLHHMATHRLISADVAVQRFITNYLDDFLFITVSLQGCNYMVMVFHGLCADLGIPIAEDKTMWADRQMVFLAILLDGE